MTASKMHYEIFDCIQRQSKICSKAMNNIRSKIIIKDSLNDLSPFKCLFK